jgi:hypothetical protein
MLILVRNQAKQLLQTTWKFTVSGSQAGTRMVVCQPHPSCNGPARHGFWWRFTRQVRRCGFSISGSVTMATLSIYSTGDGLKCTLVYHYFILPKLWSSGLLPGQLRLLRHLGIKMAQKETTFSCFNGNNNQFQEQAQYPHLSLILTSSRSMTNTTGTGMWPWYQVRFQLVSGLYHRSCFRITICISTIIGLATGKSQIFSHNKQTTSNNAGAL